MGGYISALVERILETLEEEGEDIRGQGTFVRFDCESIFTCKCTS